jgi:hypothetical protein
MSRSKARNHSHDVPMPLGAVTIATDIPLHADFINHPRQFAESREVRLANEFRPGTIFRRKRKGDADATDSDGKEEHDRDQIHLLEFNAIRFKVEGNGASFRISSIRVDPSLLLYGVECHPLVASDLARSLTVLQSTVRPLLASPEDVCLIVPGLVPGRPGTRWRSIQCRTLLPGIDIRTLHRLDHPMTGPPQGADDSQIRLKGRSKPIEILFEKAKWQVDDGDALHSVEGTRVTVTIRSHLLQWFRNFLSNVWSEDFAFHGFHPSAVSMVLNHVVAELQGIHLPVPEGWAGMGDPVTVAKTIALMSVITPIPIEELQAWDKEIRKPSASTLKRLKKEVPAARKYLCPMPISSLFQQLDAPGTFVRRRRRRSSYIDPSIAAIYGPDASSD